MEGAPMTDAIPPSVRSLLNSGSWVPGDESFAAHFSRVNGNSSTDFSMPPRDKSIPETEPLTRAEVEGLFSVQAFGPQAIRTVSGNIRVSALALHALDEFLVSAWGRRRKATVDHA
jgi:hypothetical protein